MPVQRRRATSKREFWNENWQKFLWDEWVYFFHPTDAAIREAWSHRRDDMLPAFIEQFPGCRPAGWWRCEAPEPRRKKVVDYIQRHEPQHVFLERHGLLGDDERELVVLKGLNPFQTEDYESWPSVSTPTHPQQYQ